MTPRQIEEVKVGDRVVWFGRFYTVEAIGHAPEGDRPMLTLGRVDYRTGEALPYRIVYATHPELEAY